VSVGEKCEAAAIVASLAKHAGSSAMARKLAITESAVRSHATGKAIPRKGVQERYRALYNVPLDSWTHPAGSKPPPKRQKRAKVAPELPEGPTEAPDALKTVLLLLQTAREQLEEASNDEDVPYTARASLITSASGLCRLLAQLTGSLEITQSAIVRSTAWGRILRAFETVFSRHPEASKALAEFAQELAELGE
jgi:hypothetical protein